MDREDKKYIDSGKLGCSDELDEYYDNIEDEGDDWSSYGYEVMNDCPIHMTDEPYKIKSMLEKGDQPYRILYIDSEGCYLIQSAFGNKTHFDMAKTAEDKGYFNYLSYDDDAYMVFIPKDFHGKLRWHTRLGEDSYYNCRVYDFGVLFVRDPYAYENSLFQALGEPERELYYDDESDVVYCNKDGKTIKLDVYLDLGSDPEEAITCNTEDREVVQAPTNCEVKIGRDIDATYSELAELDADSIRQKVKDFLESKYGKVVTEFDIVENNSTTIFVDNIKWANNECLHEEVKDNILDALDKEFGQEDVYMWSTYILPNGHFLNPENSSWFEDNDEMIQYEHCDFEDWAWYNGYKNNELQDVFDNCIKMNVTYPYLSMPDKARPTPEQLRAVKEIIGHSDEFTYDDIFRADVFPEDKLRGKGNHLLGVYTPIGDELFDLDVSDADDIIRAINQAYIRGSFLGEDLNEDLQEVDSEGNILSKEQVEFFKDSKVRDSSNNLLVCYHFTNNEFDTFKYSKNARNGRLNFGKAFYFTNIADDENVRGYGSIRKDCYLNLVNPLIVDARGTGVKERPKDFNGYVNGYVPEGDPTWHKEWYKYMKDNNIIYQDYAYELYFHKANKQGNDGIIIYNVADYSGSQSSSYSTLMTVYIAFNENQIKSIENKNPSNSNNINESNEERIDVYTYQTEDVWDKLQNGETYIADASQGMFQDYEEENPYLALQKALGLKHCPIFGALDRDSLDEMIRASGLENEATERILMCFGVPKSQVKFTEYYDWCDYIYALEEPEEFEEQSGMTVADLENEMKTQKSSYELCQVVLDRIEPEWFDEELNESLREDAK